MGRTYQKMAIPQRIVAFDIQCYQGSYRQVTINSRVFKGLEPQKHINFKVFLQTAFDRLKYFMAVRATGDVRVYAMRLHMLTNRTRIVNGPYEILEIRRWYMKTET